MEAHVLLQVAKVVFKLFSVPAYLAFLANFVKNLQHTPQALEAVNMDMNTVNVAQV